MLMPNSLGKSVRVVEFLDNGQEVDYLILAWEVTGTSYTPVIIGTMPLRNWAFHCNSVGDDYDATSKGRWVMPTGEVFSSVIAVRQFLGTTENQTLAKEIAKAPKRILRSYP